GVFLQIVIHEVIFNDVIERVKEHLQQADPGPQRDKLSDSLSDLETRWKDVLHRASERNDQLEEVVPLAQRYMEAVAAFLPPIDEMEDIIAEYGEVLCERHALGKEQALLKFLQQFLQEDIEGYRPVHKTLVDSADDLTEACHLNGVTEGVPKIEEDVQFMVERWNKINKFYKNRRQQVELADEKVKKYRGLLLPLDTRVKKAEKSLEESEYEGIDVEAGKKELDTMKALQAEVKSLESEIQDVGQEVNKEDSDAINYMPVKQRVKGLGSRCASLRRQLSDRVTWLERVVKEIVTLVTVTEEIVEYLSMAYEKMEQLEPIHHDAGVIKQQMDEVELLQDEVQACKPDLQAISDTFRTHEGVCKDADARNDLPLIEDEVQSMTDQYEALRRDVGRQLDRVAEVQEELAGYQEALLAVEETMREVEEVVAVEYVLVLDVQQAHEELSKVKKCVAVLDSRKPTLHTLKQHGKVLAEKTGSPDVLDKVEEAEQKYDRLASKGHDRVIFMDKYTAAVREIVPWLMVAEKKLSSINSVPCNKTSLEFFEECLRDIEHDVEEHDATRRTLNDIARSLIELNPSDKDAVSQEIRSINNRLNALTEALPAKNKQIEKMKELLANYQENLISIEELIVEGVVLCAFSTPLMDMEKLSEELELITAILVTFSEQEPVLEEIVDVAQQLIALLDRTSPDVTVIERRVEKMFARFSGVRGRLDNRKNQLGKHLEHLRRFQECNEELQTWFTAIIPVMESLAPVSTEPDNVRVQLLEVEELIDATQLKRQVLTTSQQAGEWLMEFNKEDESVTVEVVSTVSRAQVKMDRILNTLDARRDRLQTLILECQDIKVSLTDFENDMAGIEEELAGMRPVSAVHDTLKEQEREFKSEDREKELAKHSPVLHRYYGTVDPFTSWLTGLDKKLGNQEPVSCNSRTVERQLEQVRDLQQQVEEHGSQYDSVKELAANVISNAPDDVYVVEAQVQYLNKLWESVRLRLSDRVRQSAEVKDLAEEYKEAILPVNELFTRAEDGLVPMEMVGCDVDRAKQAIATTKVLSPEL
ncbi:predicted protein, partial [Nematostella vectensis]